LILSRGNDELNFRHLVIQTEESVFCIMHDPTFQTKEKLYGETGELYNRSIRNLADVFDGLAGMTTAGITPYRF